MTSPAHRRPLGRLLAMLLAAGALTAAIAAPSASAAADSVCKPYIFIGARGSGEDDAAKSGGVGSAGMGDVVSTTYSTIASLLPNLVDPQPLTTAEGYRAVPVLTRGDLALLGAAVVTSGISTVQVATAVGVNRFAEYQASVADGRAGLDTLLHRFASDCPTSKLLLAGYSQGAHVVQDTMQHADATVRSHVLAMATFGDPRFNPMGRGTLGTFDVRRHGLLGPRPADSPVRTESFCIFGDPVCQDLFHLSLTDAPQLSDIGAHFSYVLDGYAEQAGRWMYHLIRKDLIASSAPEVPEEAPPAARPLDLSLVVDTTGSMYDAIDSVRTNLQAIRDQLAAKTTDFRLALSEYKDDGDVFQSRLDLDFTDDADAFSGAIAELTADGGGDWPESVFSGLHTGLSAVSWRPDVAKAVVLVGDAPPKDPEPVTGFTESDIVTEALHVPAPIFALNICCAPETADAFGRLAAGTSGQLLSPDNGAAVADSILAAISEQSKAPVIGSIAVAAHTSKTSIRRGARLAPGQALPTVPVDTETYYSAGAAASPLGQDLTYTWDFGDGTVLHADAEDSVVGHAYRAPYDGDIRLTVTDEDGREAQALFPVKVHGDPVPPPSGLGAPELVTGDGSITARWAAPASGAPVSYEVLQGDTVVAIVPAGQPRVATLEGLPNGTPVQVSVAAYDEYGRSASSPAAVGTPSPPAGTGTPPIVGPPDPAQPARARIVLWNRTGRPLTLSSGDIAASRVRPGGAAVAIARPGVQTLTIRSAGSRRAVRVVLRPDAAPVLRVLRHGRGIQVRRVAVARASRVVVLSALHAVARVRAGGSARGLRPGGARTLPRGATTKLAVRSGRQAKRIPLGDSTTMNVVLLASSGRMRLNATPLMLPIG